MSENSPERAAVDQEPEHTTNRRLDAVSNSLDTATQSRQLDRQSLRARVTGSGARCLSLVAGLSLVGFFGVVSPASAGTNGQEIRVGWGIAGVSPVSSVTIKGHNQKGAPSTWYGVAPGSSGTETTWSYWWAGKVTITTSACGGTSTYTTIIPTDYSSNVYSVTAPLPWTCGG